MLHRASIIFDSARTGVLPGLRAVAGPERSILFSGRGLSVDVLLLAPLGGLHVLQGQVVADDGSPTAGARVRLEPDGGLVRADAFGQFSLSALTAFDGRVIHAEAAGLRLVCTIPEPAELVS